MLLVPDTDVLNRLKNVVGPAGVLEAPDDTAPFLVEWRDKYQGATPMVLRPSSTQEVSELLALCHTHRIGVVPQGGNTGLVGGQIPDRTGSQLVLSLSRMRTIRSIDPDNDTLTAEAGVTVSEAQTKAAAHDRLFALSLASEGTAQIGGVLATNAGGTNVLRYGNARDQILGLEVVLPDGRILNDLTALRKNNTGYDLKHLFAGSEGTLGVITAAVWRLFPAPQGRATALVAVPNPEAAVRLLAHTKRHAGEQVSAFELMPRFGVELVLRHHEGTTDPLAQAYPWYVLLELTAAVDRPLEADLEALLAGALESGDALDAAIAQNARQQTELWRLRENLSEAQKPEGGSIKHDVSVPISHVPAFLAEADAAVAKAVPGIRPCAFGHLGDGNIHYNLTEPEGADTAAFLDRWEAVNEIVHDLVHRFAGSISAEHGLGQMKRDEIRRYKDPVALEVMRSLKAALDPHGIMNPGKVL
ncbi:MAG: FAD-binding oxidoreductase [Pseudomonadota bacterium]